ncbi:nicotinamide mononucleotide (NMN) deamidase PncC [Clostridium beijerinckii]|nr:nicotinamide mononucleotide (NMN) deamidase PncC [Clostridium beijerinckii]
MAIGIAKTANTDVSIVTTGIAGPEGGTLEKTCWIGFYRCVCSRKGNDTKMFV